MTSIITRTTGARADPLDGEAGNGQARARLKRLAFWLDSAIPLPGGFRIGLDGLIGLVPGVGDLVAASLSSYILAEGARLGVSTSVLARMAGNVLLELLIGTVPIVGDLFDFAFKANERNVRLIESHLAEPRRTRRRSLGVVVLVGVGMLLVVAGVLASIVAFVGLVWSAVTG